jgi:flagellar hook assembly protein FlgD
MNYPNPFNPETWIPYQLARNAAVTLAIYDTKGTLVRRLEIGHQPAGFYTERGEAAYWDGRNENGESVASGLYFYQLETSFFRQLRRMVILK